MEHNQAETFGKCNFCGADKVKSPKTGKIFCSEKCWLKDQPAKPYTPDQARSADIRGYQQHKDESMRAMAARRDAVLITVAEMGQGGAWDEKLIKEKLESWRDYFTKFYADKPF